MDVPDQTPYHDLTPDVILDAVESFGLLPTGSLLALNSYENRVYQVGVEETEGPFVIAKFYRPGRWSDEAILEEHSFSLELAEREIPVVAPLAGRNAATLHHYAGFRFALFPRRGGHWPELDDPENRLRLGRFLGRIHAVGAVHPFAHRPRVDVESYGVEAYRFLLAHDFIPAEMANQYRDLVEEVLDRVRTRFAEAGEVPYIRLHGDCHPGNILWTDTGAHFVDLDDCRNGPAMQDLWMLLSGDRRLQTEQLSDILEGYEEFHEFDRRELHLIEALRALRLIYYAYWLAKRWQDPAFPQAFPWFGTPRYWDEQVLTLREQAERLDAPPLGPL